MVGRYFWSRSNLAAVNAFTRHNLSDFDAVVIVADHRHEGYRSAESRQRHRTVERRAPGKAEHIARYRERAESGIAIDDDIVVPISNADRGDPRGLASGQLGLADQDDAG